MAAFVGRVGFLFAARGWELRGDGFAYRIEAGRILHGDLPGPLHPPGWTFVLAVADAIGLDGLHAQQVFTALIGTAAVVMVGFAGREVAGPRVGLIGAVVAAIYPNFWIYEREPLSLLAVATMIWLVFRFRAAPTTGKALGLGIGLGVSAQVRSELIALSVVVVVPIILARVEVPWRRRVTWLVGAGVACLVLLVPSAAFNKSRYERPILLSSGMGPAMRAGNCGPTFHGELLGYYHLGCILLVPDLSEDPSVSDGQLRSLAIEQINRDRGQAALVAAARVGRVFNVYRPFQQARFEAERGSALWVTRAALLSYWGLLPFSVAGAVLLRRRKVPLYPLLAFPGIVVVSVLPTIGAVRYRAIAEVTVAILAAVAIDRLLATRGGRTGETSEETAGDGESVADDGPQLVQERSTGHATLRVGSGTGQRER